MSAPCIHSPASPASSSMTMYFVVFPCNGEPIFHSNRIPQRLLNGVVHDGESLPSPELDNILFLGPPHVADEVAQQRLQDLAFPLAFGIKSGPTLKGGIRRQEGPLWSGRVETVRSACGTARYHRLIVISNFVVSVASRMKGLSTMQTKHAAAALVITCPPQTLYFQFLLDNFSSVVRSMLHVTLAFAMKTTQYFFTHISSKMPQRQLVSKLEADPSAVATCHTLRAMLVNALAHRHAIPRLRSHMGALTVTSPPRLLRRNRRCFPTRKCTAAVDELLFDALRSLWRYSDDFTSRVIVGFLSLTNWEGYGIVRETLNGATANTGDTYESFWHQMKEAEDAEASDLECTETGRNSSWAERETPGCPLSTERVGRVVVFGTDPDLARCLLIVAAFFFRDAHASHSNRFRHIRGQNRNLSRTEVNDSLVMEGGGEDVVSGNSPSPFAAQVLSCMHPSLPVQWINEEYTPSRVEELLCSPYTVDNTVLVVAPRTMVCRRMRFNKTFTSNSILIERFGEGETTMQPIQPFKCRQIGDEMIQVDDTVRLAVREALQLQECSRGSVSCAELLEDFAVWVALQSRTRRLIMAQQHSPSALSEATVPTTRTASATASGIPIKNPIKNQKEESHGVVEIGTSYNSVNTCASISQSPKTLGLPAWMSSTNGRRRGTSCDSSSHFSLSTECNGSRGGVGGCGGANVSMNHLCVIFNESIFMKGTTELTSQLTRFIME